MPRLRVKQNEFEAKVKYYATLNRMGIDILAKKTGFALSTLYLKFKNPEKLTVKEIAKISTVLQCDWVDLIKGSMPKRKETSL